MVPLYLTIITSLKSTPGLYKNLISPTMFEWENYLTIWFEGRFSTYFLNSLIITIPVVLLTVIFSSLAGYFFAKMDFPKKEVIFLVFLFGLMIPLPALIVPLYFNLSAMGLLNSYLGVILPEVGIQLPFGIFLMRTFSESISDEIIDAARVEGASKIRLFTKIILPLSIPGLQSLGIISFMFAWQRYLLPLLVIQDVGKRPLTVGVFTYLGRYTIDYPGLTAAAIITFTPIAVVFLILQRAFTKGLTMGAIK